MRRRGRCVEVCLIRRVLPPCVNIVIIISYCNEIRKSLCESGLYLSLV